MAGRFRITLQQHLDWLAAQGHELRIRIPPRYEQLWRRAREAELHLGDLYVLRAPLEAHMGGSYNRESGDVCVVHAEDRPEAGLRSLLHDLAHGSRRSPVPETIDPDWDEEREFCPETKHECRAHYERGESTGSVQTAAVSACKLPGPLGHECDAGEHAEQLVFFG